MASPERTPAQLVLDLPHRQALGEEDFLVSSSNAAAVQLNDDWPNWPEPAIAVVGPAGTGKSHLAHVWCLKSGARTEKASTLGEDTIQAMESGRPLVVEDIDRGLACERILFHVLNIVRERGSSVLLTSRLAPGEISIALPDLRSRLRALPVARIEPPDDMLLKAVLVKLFADRQIVVDPAIVTYLALHMDRSMEAANRVVSAIDRLSLSMRRKVTRAIAAEALGLARRGDPE